MSPPNDAPLAEKFDHWLSLLRGVQDCGSYHKACCPAHDDDQQSLSTSIGEKGIVAKCHAGCTFVSICHAVNVPASWTFDRASEKRTRKKSSSRVTGEWIYRDEMGDPLFRTVRMEDGTRKKDGKLKKEFRQERPTKKGSWIGGVKGIRQVPYRLPEIVSSFGPVLVVEGERHCDRLAELGHVATCNAGGAGKWTADHARCLAGRDVIILPDNDKAGRDHARKVAASLAEIASSVTVAILPELPEKGDVIDFLDGDGTPEQLQASLDAAGAIEDVLPETDEGSTDAGDEGDEDSPDVTAMDIARCYLKRRHDHPERPTLIYHRRAFYEYSKTHYRTLEEDHLKCLVTPVIDELCGDVKMNDLSAVMQCLKSLSTVPPSVEQPAWINGRDGHFIALRNGVLNLNDFTNGEDACLLSHSPNWFSQVCLPYEYDPEATCPRWFDSLMSSLDGNFELTNLLQEWFGYLLSKSTDRQKFAILIGEGGTGKSTACAALQAMLGRENVSSVSLEDLGGRFQLHRTLGKLANISAETEDVTKVAEGRLKALTSGDSVAFEEKGKPVFDAVPTARFMFAMNNLPRFADRSSGLWRRMILIPFDRVIPEEEKIRGMDKADWWVDQGEAPGIFNWAVEGLKRLVRNGFSESSQSTRLIEAFRRESNPAREFLLSCFREDPEGKIVTRDVYANYRSECQKAGVHPLNEVHFGREIKRTFPSAVQKRFKIDGELKYGYSGICEGSEDE